MEQPPTDDVPDISAALTGFMPDLRRKNRDGWVMIATIAMAAILALVVVQNLAAGNAHDLFQYRFMAVLGAILGVGLVFQWVRRQHGTMIMPFIAQTAGLTFNPSAKGFADRLPPRLLPTARERKSEDLISGRIGDRFVEMAEVSHETGGKGSKMLFKGIVLAFPNLARMPPFFLAPEDQTEARFLSPARIKVDDLVRIGSRTGRGKTYGVWSSSPEVADHPGLDAVLQILTNLDSVGDGKAQLFSATSDGTIIHVALSHQRNLFALGGLMASQDQLMADIHQAYADLTLPMTIAARLLDAERAALSA